MKSLFVFSPQKVNHSSYFPIQINNTSKGGARRARCNAVPNHSTPKLAIGISTTFATTSGRSRP